jgi:hypothetical protein
MTFTDKEKLAEIDRELAQRHRVYRWQVRNGRMTQEQASRQLNLMTAIRMDYHAKVEASPEAAGPLFAAPAPARLVNFNGNVVSWEEVERAVQAWRAGREG